MKQIVLAPAKVGKITPSQARKAVKAVLARNSKAEKVAAGKDITQ